MFDIASTELLIVAVVALVVIGPKDLPRVMRTVGNWVGQARGMARHFRAGMDAMIRESELEDMEKKWKAENERIMREHPAAAPDAEWGGEPPAGTAVASPASSGAAPPADSAPPTSAPPASRPAPPPDRAPPPSSPPQELP